MRAEAITSREDCMNPIADRAPSLCSLLMGTTDATFRRDLEFIRLTIVGHLLIHQNQHMRQSPQTIC